jgi:cytochrome b
MRPDRHAVWDLPVRVFHWSLVVLVLLQWGTAEWGWLSMQWHARFGYATLALVLFRIAWGFVGSESARFEDFVRGPRAVWRYVASTFGPSPQRFAGHNPLGGWSVVALLGCLLVQAITGLFAYDDIDAQGPLSVLVSDGVAKAFTEVHEVNKYVLLALVGLHVLAVTFHEAFMRDPLVAAMFTGEKRLDGDPGVRFASAWRAVFLFALSAAIVWAIVELAPKLL